MMPLNLKSTRHLLTSPHMQPKSTEETWSLWEDSPTGSRAGSGAYLWAQPWYLMGKHIRLDCSRVHPFLNLGVPARRKDCPLKMMTG